MQSIADIVKNKKFNMTQAEIGIKPSDNNPPEYIKLKALVETQSSDIIGTVSKGNVDYKDGNLTISSHESVKYGTINRTIMEVEKGELFGHRYLIELHVYENPNGIMRAWYAGFLNNLNMGYVRNLVGKWNENIGGKYNVKSEDIV